MRSGGKVFRIDRQPDGSWFVHYYDLGLVDAHHEGVTDVFGVLEEFADPVGDSTW